MKEDVATERQEKLNATTISENETARQSNEENKPHLHDFGLGEPASASPTGPSADEGNDSAFGGAPAVNCKTAGF